MRTMPDWDVSEYQKAIPDLELCVDQNKDAYQNFLNALELAGDDPCVHLEDDIILCDDFVERVLNEIKKRPNEVIQFFSVKKKEDLEMGSRHMFGRRFMWNQCFYLPEKVGNEILEYGKTWEKRDNIPPSYGLMMAYYFDTKGMEYWNVVPNLVDHKHCISRIDPKRSTERQSCTFEK